MIRLYNDVLVNTAEFSTLEQVTNKLRPKSSVRDQLAGFLYTYEEDLGLLKLFAELCTGTADGESAEEIEKRMQTYARENVLREAWAQEVEGRVRAFIEKADEAQQTAEAKAEAEAKQKAEAEQKAAADAQKQQEDEAKAKAERKAAEEAAEKAAADVEAAQKAAEEAKQGKKFAAALRGLRDSNADLGKSGAAAGPAAAAAADESESGATAAGADPAAGAAAPAAVEKDSEPYPNHITIENAENLSFAALGKTEQNVVKTIFDTFLQNESDRKQLAIQTKFEATQKANKNISGPAAFFKMYAKDEPYLEFYYSTDVRASKVAAPSDEGKIDMIAFAVVSEADTDEIDRIRNNGATKEIQLLKRLSGDKYKTAGSRLLDRIFDNDSDNTFVIEPNNARVAYYYRNNVQRDYPSDLVKVKIPVETDAHNPWTPKSWAEELMEAEGTSDFVKTLKNNKDLGRMTEWICGKRKTWAQKLKKGNKIAANQRLIRYIEERFAKDGSDMKDPQGEVQTDAVWQEMWRAKFLDFFFESKALEAMNKKQRRK